MAVREDIVFLREGWIGMSQEERKEAEGTKNIRKNRSSLLLLMFVKELAQEVSRSNLYGYNLGRKVVLPLKMNLQKRSKKNLKKIEKRY